MTSHTVTVTHTFETGHRLPHLQGKCTSLHGHSWQVQVAVSGHTDLSGVVVEFADLKRHLRGWVDHHLDHGLMLGHGDPLLDLLAPYGKTYEFGDASSDLTADLLWPTVENVATLLARVMQQHLVDTGQSTRCHVEQVHVQETAVNRATWSRV